MASRMNPAPPRPDVEAVSLPTTFSIACTAKVEPFRTLFVEEEPFHVGDWPTEEMEEDDIQVIFVDVKSHRSQNKRTASHAKELNNLRITNRRLTKENESLLKELEDLKLQAAQQKSQNIRAQQEQSNQVLDVLNSELTCAICSDIIIEATAIECGHIFCSYCISTWLTQQTVSRSCPECRAVTYRDPIKIVKLSSTIDSLHKLLSKGAQFDRRHALQDRKAELKRAREALASREKWFQNLSHAHERVTESVRHLRGLSPDINAFEGS